MMSVRRLALHSALPHSATATRELQMERQHERRLMPTNESVATTTHRSCNDRVASVFRNYTS